MAICAPGWSDKYDFLPLEKGEDGVYLPDNTTLEVQDDLPDNLPWHSALHFKDLDEGWRVIYSRGDDKPVLIERRFGAGTVVMATDSYYLSNEAMRDSPRPRFLAWLVGGSRRVLFDETHLGVEDKQSVMTLAWRYRLQGAFAALLLLALLFVWKNHSSLAPPPPDGANVILTQGAAEKDAGTGLVNLLERNIPNGQALEVCFQEWQKNTPLDSGGKNAKLQRMKQAMEREKAKSVRARDAAAAYREMSEIWNER